ncbi:transcription initiation factor TFIID subunit 3 [Zerene cesonia]|uniref:transcription initiation factor TFIID subunit 3 n=1 Tax=Zerene cesonia TaxID=33412 RepID=UPI0018E4E357|nr:transcription initiation factor TFIID subunit 3 [Zerene cesonia]
MSTRRARIKAVTALPPRRKNAATAESTKPPKNDSPKQSTLTSDREENVQLPESVEPTLTTGNDNNSTPKTVHSENVNTKEKETQPVTPSTSTTRNVFASPIIRHSPKRAFASPLIRNSPKRPFTSPNRVVLQNPSKGIDTAKTKTPLHQATPTRHELTENTELRVASNSISKIEQNNVGSKANTDDYNVPSVPESITEDAMDGIVPLQPARNTPKPLEKLKNEIISENAEVIFDPIVPLPSPSKVRPKLRPVPRLGPRRNSIQGSASESEDESRRSLLSGGTTTPAPARQRHDPHTPHLTLQGLLNREVSRIRNDSVSSNMSQATTQPAPASPLKEKIQKSRRIEASRRLMAMRRRREAVKREALTMYDLIFYNPTTNPIVPDQDELKAKEESIKDLEKQKKEMKEEDADDPPESDAAPVPQLKLGPNGEIVLDESSLVIKQTQTQKVSSVVREGGWQAGRGQYKRSARSADWSAPETVRFYRALAAIGTDFTLMAPLFPDRTRRELKLKFKKEEKVNGAQVDKALRSRIEWDAISLKDEFTEEREVEKRRAQEEKDKFMRQKKEEKDRLRAAKEIGHRRSRGLKALEVSVKANSSRHKTDVATADDLLERARQTQPLKRTIPKSPIPIPPPNIATPPTPTLTTLAMINKRQKTKDTPSPANAATSRTPNVNKTPEVVTSLNNIPSNIETGSLIVLTVNNPKSPGKKMLQTYIAHEPGKLTQVALPTVLLNSVVGYMKKGTPKSTVSNSSSPLMSPNSNSDSRTSTPSAKCSDSTKRSRNSSFSITQL